MVLYSDNSMRVLVSADDAFRESDIQTISDSSEEVMVEESASSSEETSSELESSEETSQSYGDGRSDSSEGFAEDSEVGSSGNETAETVELLTHIDKTSNSFLGLFVICLVLLGIGLIIRFIWGLLNK